MGAPEESSSIALGFVSLTRVPKPERDPPGRISRDAP